MDTQTSTPCQRNKTELALPAGSLQCALHAFKGGADAVYLGMKAFSARKGAVNFSFEDLRKLKAYCIANSKKFYITLNTLAQDNQLGEVYELLKQLDYLKPDGIIVQDLGIAKLMRERFPGLPLHASTQLAVHTVDGVKELQGLGFTRVVLSRELSFDEVKAIREACPDVEIKVFIHGAMCYGFSGLCMASQLITGRSANCGACAQICRTWFTCRETDEDKWFFSMKDMNLGPLVRKYQEIGIDSLKIEGRMKGPDYCFWCAKYYSQILAGADENSDEVRWAKEAMEISFSRESTTGFFNAGKNGSTGSQNMICSDFPSHRGIQIGTIEKVMQNKALVRFCKPVALRDGLLVLSGGKSAGFALTYIEGGRSFIAEGDTQTINFPTSDFERKPGFGTPLFCTSRHNLNPSQINENIPLFKQPIKVEVDITDKGIVLNGELHEIEIQQSKSNANLDDIFTKVFEASDKSYFTLGSLSVKNSSSFSSPFIPMSLLKQIRRTFYEQLDNAFEQELGEVFELKTNIKTAYTLPNRSFIALSDKMEPIEGRKYLTLSPLMFNEDEYLKSIDKTIAENPDVIIGLNNVGQIPWARKHPETKFFADIFLYTQNSLAFEQLQAEIPNLIGSYEITEGTSFTTVDKAFKVPLFISRVCFRHNGLGISCAGCSRNNRFTLEQNGRKYSVLCKDCITIMTED